MRIALLSMDRDVITRVLEAAGDRHELLVARDVIEVVQYLFLRKPARAFLYDREAWVADKRVLDVFPVPTLRVLSPPPRRVLLVAPGDRTGPLEGTDAVLPRGSITPATLEAALGR